MDSYYELLQWAYTHPSTIYGQQIDFKIKYFEQSSSREIYFQFIILTEQLWLIKNPISSNTAAT